MDSLSKTADQAVFFGQLSPVVEFISILKGQNDTLWPMYLKIGASNLVSH